MAEPGFIGLKSLGFQSLRLFAGVTGLTIPDGTEQILLTIEGASVKFRDDGTDPTTLTGQNLVMSGAPWMYASQNLSGLKFCQVSATTSIVNATFYGRS